MARASVASRALLSSDVPGLPASATQRCRRAASVSSRAVANALRVSTGPALVRVTGRCGDIAAGARVKRVIRRACLAAVVGFGFEGCGEPSLETQVRSVEAYESLDAAAVARVSLVRVGGISLRGDAGGGLLDVSDVSLGPTRVAVIDRMSNRVAVFERESGELRGSFGGRRSLAPSGLSDPVRVNWLEDGSLLVLDITHPTRLRRFSESGDLLGPFMYQPPQPAVAAVTSADVVVLGLVDPENADRPGRVVAGSGAGRRFALNACPRNAMLDQSRRTRGMIASFALLDVAVVADTVYCAEGISPLVGVSLLDGTVLPDRRVAPPWYRPPRDRRFSNRESEFMRFQSEWTYHARLFTLKADLVSVFLETPANDTSSTFRLFGCPRALRVQECWSTETALRPLGVTREQEFMLLERVPSAREHGSIGLYILERAN